MSETITITIRPDATVETVYQDAARSLYEDIGTPTVRRASHVEPTADGRWAADMSPVGGPLLAATDTREESLDAELDWLRDNLQLGEPKATPARRIIL